MNGIFERIRASNAPLNHEVVEKAYYFAQKAHAGQTRKSGEPYFVHPCEVAGILLDLGMDTETIAAAFLHDVVEDTDVTMDQIRQEFGDDIAQLVDGVTKLNRVQFTSTEEQKAESLRKMLLAMAADIRVITIKLADRLHNMRTLRYRSEPSQYKVAQETLEIYAPLAHRLGINTIKWELEDLAFQVLHPDSYNDIAKKVAMQRKQREQSVAEIIALLEEKLAELGIHASIMGRPKHFYSIYTKMVQQHKAFEEIYDLTAVRILVDTVRDCYAVLGAVHTMWKPLPGRFKDYIAVPKPNFYQSLHSTVIGRQGIPFEIQIRTYEMHNTAEYGIAAHWKYKQKGATDSDMDQKLSWLRQILEWQDDARDSEEFINALKLGFFSEEVFVFTPKGDVIDLPQGSTPIDFAYAIHSGVGNRCIGAKIDGRMVPLDSVLKTGNIVSIITSKTANGPSLDWLKIAKAPQTRAKIRSWFKKERRDENIERGTEIMEESAKRYGYKLSVLMRSEWLEPLYKRFSINSQEDMYATVGYGGLSSAQILLRLIEEYKKENRAKNPEPPAEEEPRRREEEQQRTVSNGVIIKGEKNMLIRFARCCNPLPQDPIIGFITRGRGVSIHRIDCANIRDLDQEGRFIEAEWERGIESSYHTELRIEAKDRPGLLAEVSDAVQQLGSHIEAINARMSREGDVHITLTVEIRGKQQLDTLMRQLRRVAGTQDVSRTHAGEET